MSVRRVYSKWPTGGQELGREGGERLGGITEVLAGAWHLLGHGRQGRRECQDERIKKPSALKIKCNMVWRYIH